MAKDKMRKEARKKMLKELKSHMSDDMHGGMKDKMQKVSVMSDSKKGLDEGLSKAQEILKARKEYKDGGVKARTTEAPDSLGKGKAEYRGYKEDPAIMKKKPKYIDHRKEFPKMMHNQYKDGGYKKLKKQLGSAPSKDEMKSAMKESLGAASTRKERKIRKK